MNRLLRTLGVVALLFVAACSDQAVQSDPSGEIPDDFLTPALDIVDGNNNDGNGHFFWLKPIADVKGKDFTGVADGSLRPTVEICPRNAAGDGCADAPLVASYTVDQGADKDRIVVDDKDQYYVHWRMNDYPPERDGVYRIRVTLQGAEFGHVDVITLRQKDIKSFVSDPAGDLIPISDNGAFKIYFRLEQGALEDLFCDFDGDGDVDDCNAAVEQPGDGIDTEVTVTSETGGGGSVVAKITAPDAVFTDAGGTPIENVVVTAEVEVTPPSADVLTDDDQELPYFVEVNTYPSDVFIDPNGPGVTVVICQDEAELASRGIADALHPQLILYKVGDNGVTRRLETNFGAPECASPIPAPAPSNVLGMIKWGAQKLLGVVGPQPLVARRLHGGLNTTITRDISLDEAFSTFGAVLGPNAGETEAILPAQGIQGETVEITVDVQNALGEHFAFGGDTLTVTVSGANAGAPVSVVDNGNGFYTATYTPNNAGTDQIAIVLTRSDGFGLGPIGGSPFPLEILQGLTVINTADAGVGSLRWAMDNALTEPGLDTVRFAIPGPGPHTIALASALPNITDATVVDGTTQPGYAGVPVVAIDGAGYAAGPSSGHGFAIYTDNVTIRGMAIVRQPRSGIFALQGTNGAVIEDNHIGTNGAGAAGLGNTRAGLRFRSSNSTIRNNVISGNAENGILLDEGATGNTVEDNVIGLAPDGTTALGNGWDGITMFNGVSNTVVEDNLISANGGFGIDIQHSGALAPVTGTQIRGNIIGLDAAGNLVATGPGDVIVGPTNFGPALRGNASGGIRANNAPGTVVGGAGTGNVISGNRGDGVAFIGPAVAPAPVVRGNVIGLDPTGSSDRGNRANGVSAFANGVQVGGPSPADRNVISGNHSDGVETGNSASGVVVEGNYVGVDATGSTGIGNGFGHPGCCRTGVFVRAGGNTVRGNVVSANWLGIRSGDSGSPGNLIENNLVGTDAGGAADLGNQNDGIGLYGDKSGTQVRGNTVRFNGTGVAMVEGTEDALIGGTNPGDGNTIADNDGIGVRVGYNTAAGDIRNTIRGNQIVDNGGLGIDLAGNFITANDSMDVDSGPNGLVNRPELLAAYNGLVPGMTQMQVRLNAAPGTSYDVEFFASATCDPSGSGEGQTPLLVVSTAATNGSGYLTFGANLPIQSAGTAITATATDPSGSTSEFSVCETVQTVPAGVFYWAPSDGGNGHFYQYVTGSETWTAAATAATGLSVLGTSGHLVTITSGAEQAFVESVRFSLALPDWRPWIGLRDVTGTGGWAWVTGEFFGYDNWGGGEPNNIGTELYVEMFASGVWNNNTNGPVSPLGYLVEYPVP